MISRVIVPHHNGIGRCFIFNPIEHPVKLHVDWNHSLSCLPIISSINEVVNERPGDDYDDHYVGCLPYSLLRPVLSEPSGYQKSYPPKKISNQERAYDEKKAAIKGPGPDQDKEEKQHAIKIMDTRLLPEVSKKRGVLERGTAKLY